MLLACVVLWTSICLSVPYGRVFHDWMVIEKFSFDGN